MKYVALQPCVFDNFHCVREREREREGRGGEGKGREAVLFGQDSAEDRRR